MRIKRRILAGEHPLEHQAAEAQLATQPGLAREPVHDAVAHLLDEGLVERITNGTPGVAGLSALDCGEIGEILGNLEPAAAQLAARRRPRPRMLEPMGLALEEMERALERDDLDSWAKADEAYHRCLFELCGNSRLAILAHGLRARERQARMVSLQLGPRPWRTNSEYVGVLDAIWRGDDESARRRQARHRERVNEALRRLLERHHLFVL